MWSTRCGTGDERRHPAPSTSSATESVKAFDGPFGLKQGLTPAEVAKLATAFTFEGQNSYSADTLPIKHDGFLRYNLGFSSTSGLCFVAGISKDIATGLNGKELLSEFNSLSDEVSDKYGKSKNYDHADSIGGDPEFLMITLYDNKRSLARVWAR